MSVAPGQPCKGRASDRRESKSWRPTRVSNGHVACGDALGIFCPSFGHHFCFQQSFGDGIFFIFTKMSILMLFLFTVLFCFLFHRALSLVLLFFLLPKLILLVLGERNGKKYIYSFFLQIRTENKTKKKEEKVLIWAKICSISQSSAIAH